MKNLSFMFALIFSLTLAMGCASTPPNVVNIDRASNLQAEIEKTRSDFSHEADNQLKILSPEYARKAEKSLNKAQDAFNDKKTDDSFKNLEEARAWLNMAKTTAPTTRTVLAAPLAARADAVAVKDPDNKKLDSADDDFKDVARKIEKGDHVSQSDKQDLVNKYADVQRARLTHVYIVPIEERLEQAKDLRAKKYAPRTFEKAEQELKAAQKTLEINPIDKEQIMERIKTADASSLEALSVTRQVADASAGTTEEMVLNNISAQNRANRNYQAAMSERNQLSAEVAELKEKAGPHELMQKLQESLPKDKAEIFLNPEGEVTLRLKDLQFRTNSSDLTPDAAIILSDVKNTLAEVAPKKLVIEGHTDSTGGKKINKPLSKSRAETVAEFLKNDETLSRSEMDVIGMGAEQPLKNNNTKAGRAENRRVEITVQGI